MQKIISPLHKKLEGIYLAPPSKSITQRAYAAALLREGLSTISNYGNSEDDNVALNIIQVLGAQVIEKTNASLTISSKGLFKNNIASSEIFVGESGLSSRMFLPIISLLDKDFTIHAAGSLLVRPVDILQNILSTLGVKITADTNTYPLKIKGTLTPQDIETEGNLSSQFLTGLIFAYTAAAANNTIVVNNLVSKPYIDLTLQVLEDFGFRTPKNDHYHIFTFSQDKTIHKKALHYCIEGDWSSASYFLVAAAIAGDVTIQGLDLFTQQADKAILEPLMECGCNLSITEKEIKVRSSGVLKAFQFDATHCPDLFPALVALASYCRGTSVIEGISRLQHKESNRAMTLKESFGILGVDITLQDDLMIIRNEASLQGGVIDSYGDHRIAMAIAIASLKAESDVIIKNASVVSKSYPTFFEELKALGATIKEDE